MISRLGVSGLGIPTVGVAYGLGAEGLGGDSANARWETQVPETVAESSIARQVYLDGALTAAAEEGARQALLTGLRPGAIHQAALLPLSLVRHLQRPDGSSGMFAAQRRGPRVCLSWADQPDDGDFAAYVLYWDGGLGGTPATLLAVISDRNTLEYRTDEQPAGTYRFALAYRDSAGNESAIGTVLEEVVPQRPPAVDNFALSYSDSTRRVTLTWDTPSGGWSSNVRRLVIFDNWCPGCSWLAPYANSDPAFRRGDVAKTETSWTSDNLWQGRDSAGALAPWRFDVRALLCDELGSDWGPSVAEELMLVLDSGTLGEVSAAPARPELLAVEPIAGAKCRARWRVGSLDNITGFQVVRDGSEVSSVATVSGQFDYADDSGALSDGTTYQVAVRAYNGSDSYSQSATLPVTVDGTAPTGDGVLSGGLCN